MWRRFGGFCRFPGGGRSIGWLCRPEGFIEGSGGFAERGRNHAQTVFRIRSHWSVDSSPSVRICRCLVFFHPPDDFTPSGEFFHFAFFFDVFLCFSSCLICVFRSSFDVFQITRLVFVFTEWFPTYRNFSLLLFFGIIVPFYRNLCHGKIGFL